MKMMTQCARAAATRAAKLLAVAALGGVAPTAFADAPAPAAAVRQDAHFALAEKNLTLALALYLRAAQAGDLLAAERAGELLLDAESAHDGAVPRDLAHAAALLERAACAGSASAAVLLDELRVLRRTLARG